MLIGRRINDRYKIIELIGGGGMANVYLARDIILERYVAVKVLRLDYADDPEFIRRFHREAQSATSLSHPNIVNIYDVGEEDNIYYIVMEYINGETLKQYIQKNYPIPLEKIIDIMQQLTDAISHAHQYNIIHRDIKPQNILIDRNENVKVTDFGIAVALTSTTITHTNSVMGSVHYISPEQARGGIATKQSDIYALGIVMYEMLTGRLPFSGESAVSIALKHVQNETPSPKRFNPEIPQSVENIVLKATAKDPYYRYNDVEEMQEDLRTCLDPERLNEKPFIIPVDEEQTKAIPVLNTKQIVNKEVKPLEEVPKKLQETPLKDQPVKKRKKWPWVIGTLSVLIILSLLLFFFVFPDLFGPKDIDVPDVREEELEAAIEILTESGLVVENTVPLNHDEIPENHVIQTDPRHGKTVKEGTEVTIYVSIGKEKVVLQDYINRDIETVIDLLDDRGYEIEIKEEFHDSEPGTIIAQEPEAGTEVVPEETKLIFTVSKGVETFELRDLKNYGEGPLKDYADEYGIKIEVVDTVHDEKIPEGNVISQNPAPGTKIKKGDVVEVVVSKGPEPQLPQVVTRDFVVPYWGEPVEGEEELPKQTIRIYIGDMTYDFNKLYDIIEVTEDTRVSIELTIPPGETAKYKIMIDDVVFIEEEVPYPNTTN